ncbi:MAG: phosphoenolpyruvate carboxylase, partial [Atopobium sp.]|nr:phosphoenolpyruvate carboxylase [Atopobium sp.]
MAGNPQDSNLESSNASFDEKPIDGATTSEVAQSLLERRGNEIAAARTLIQALKAPAPLRDNLTFFLRLVRKVLAEYNPDLLTSFDTLLVEAIKAGPDDLSTTRAPLLLEAINAVLKVDSEKESLNAFLRFASTIDNLSMEDSVLLMRAFVTFFHLANLCEENYRVTSLRSREASVDPSSAEDPINEITVAYRQLIDECGEEEAKARLNRLEFHPVFTAHPTEARRKNVERRIRTISELLDERQRLGGPARMENERRMLQEIDGLFRTSPIGHKKPTPLEEADTVLNIFDTTLFEMVPSVYRRFDNWVLGENAGCVPPVCPPFFRPGSWIGSDRDGNPNVTALVSRQVAEKYRVHVLQALARATKEVSRGLTLDGISTPASPALANLWAQQVEMSQALTSRAIDKAGSELHRAAMRVISGRLSATIERNADLMYQNAEEFIADLRVIQDSLAQAGAFRIAYGPVQKLIWQAQTFGFHLVEMEFRQHSLVHKRALADIEAHPSTAEKPAKLDAMTQEVLDTFRSIGSIQKKNGINAARRYIISFT